MVDTTYIEKSIRDLQADMARTLAEIKMQNRTLHMATIILRGAFKRNDLDLTRVRKPMIRDLKNTALQYRALRSHLKERQARLIEVKGFDA